MEPLPASLLPPRRKYSFLSVLFSTLFTYIPPFYLFSSSMTCKDVIASPPSLPLSLLSLARVQFVYKQIEIILEIREDDRKQPFGNFIR